MEHSQTRGVPLRIHRGNRVRVPVSDRVAAENDLGYATWSADGIEHPPLTTDAKRWRKLAVNPRWATIRSMTDATTNVRIAIDEVARTITVKTEVWRYSQPDPEHLVLDGPWSGHTLHVTLRLEPDPLLVTSHWIQEAPLTYRS